MNRIVCYISALAVKLLGFFPSRKGIHSTVKADNLISVANVSVGLRLWNRSERIRLQNRNSRIPKL